jgi:phosphoribosylanthranilate isomerase
VRVRDSIASWTETGADLVLLDAYAPTQRGGTGRRFDWGLLADLADRDRYGLSGGLDPANVADGVRLGLGLIDVSSGVEESPGKKSPMRIREFLRARRGRRREAARS